MIQQVHLLYDASTASVRNVIIALSLVKIPIFYFPNAMLVFFQMLILATLFPVSMAEENTNPILSVRLRVQYYYCEVVC